MIGRTLLLVASACALLAVACALPLDASPRYTGEQAEALFNAWSTQHGKSYTDSQVKARFAAFRANLEFVAAHNEAAANGLHTYTVEMNQFADLTAEEYKATYLGFRFNGNNAASNNTKALSGNAPAAIDWRTKGAVTPVKNQGQCGSCWSFSATGALEGANFIKSGKLVSLSEQELLDCDTVDSACNGGLMDNAFDFVKGNGGIDSEDDWKYLARQTIFFKCTKSHEAKKVATCTGHTDVPTNDESQLQLAAALQPVSIAIEADQPSFQLYKSGVMTGACGTNLDHGVLLVGYGTDNGQDYWIVKNSWGEGWGEKGYIRLARNVADKAGQCGLTLAASYPQA